MSDKTSRTEWLSAIVYRAHERENHRQVQYNNLRKAGIQVGRYLADRLPILVPEFVKMILGSLLAFWIIGTLMAYIFHVNPLYTLSVIGLAYSVQATYYKHRLSVDPNYKIPTCRCAGRRNDNTEIILQSKESAILGIPNSVLGAVLYSTLLLFVYLKHADAAMLVAIVAVLMSAYLSYVMVVRIRNLCVNCINVAALNALIVWQFLR